ncbi:lysophospholipase, partial [Phenoliferia sp. Uapishka_3]
MHFAVILPALAGLAVASPVHLDRRATALRDSPSGTYAPTVGACPASGVTIRQGAIVDPQEAAYIQEKTVTSLGDWKSYLGGVGLEGLDVNTFVSEGANADPGKTMPLVGFAVSGGGQRAMLVGGGILAAFDNRNATAVAAKSGGVLQIAQYLVGLSGGSWLTGSYAVADFPSFESLRDDVWDMTENFFAPKQEDPTGVADAVASIGLKHKAGSPVSSIDAYGRILAYHLVNDTRSPIDVTSGPGAATLWSSIKKTSNFISRIAPFPIIISCGRTVGNRVIDISSPIYESTPYTFGTNLPSSGGLSVPIEYLGTNFTAGVASSQSCVTGFDNAAFLMGCSGNILGAPIFLAERSIDLTAITDNPDISAALDAVPDEKADNGRVINPFAGLSSATGYPASADLELALIDGGFGGENVPFFPLIQPQRALDVIIAIDASADTDNFPDGREIYHTYQKTQQPGYSATPFPVIPPVESFVAQGLNKRPVFFGSDCYAQPQNVSTPLVVYVPNYNIVFATNTSTGTNSYSNEDTQSFFDNGFAIATQSLSPSWSSCLACALVDAQQGRNGVARSEQCQSCFAEYCYMGTM